MSNVQISALPSTTSTTFNDWVIKNDSGETTTSKAQLKDVLGMTSLNGNNAIQSSKWLTQLGTTASTQSAIAIGNGAEATSPYSIAIGYEAFNQNRDGARDYYICIGYQSRSVQGATAIGKNAQALGANATSVGQNAQSYGNGGFALGNSSLNQGQNGVAVGSNASDRTNNGGIAIGDVSNTWFDGGISIGVSSTSSGTSAVSIGRSSEALSDYSVAIGHGAQTLQPRSVALGYAVGTLYSATTHVDNIHTYRTETFDVIAAGNVGGNINVDCSLGTIFTFTMTANTTPNFINIRTGQRFIFIVNNNGSYTVPTATVNGAGGTVFAKGGSLNPTNNGYTKYQAVYASGILWLDEELNFQAV